MTPSLTSSDILADRKIESWDDINAVLDEFAQDSTAPADLEFARNRGGGVAFLTFEYGIDGVTIEIAKYASCLEHELRDRGLHALELQHLHLSNKTI